jgi:hypothetical protein
LRHKRHWIPVARAADLRAPDELGVEPETQVESFIDSFRNRCTRFLARQGTLRLSNSTPLEDPGFADQVNCAAHELPVQELPNHTLRYLLNSRYCEVDRFSMSPRPRTRTSCTFGMCRSHLKRHDGVCGEHLSGVLTLHMKRSK